LRYEKLEEHRVVAVYDEDLERALVRLGLCDDIVAGKATCLVCGKVITFDNLGGLVKYGGTIRVICDDLLCLLKAHEVKRAARTKEE